MRIPMKMQDPPQLCGLVKRQCFEPLGLTVTQVAYDLSWARTRAKENLVQCSLKLEASFNSLRLVVLVSEPTL